MLTVSKMNHIIKETGPGHIEISCNLSGLPYTRTSNMGMFCDATNCVCEKRSREMASFFKDIVDQIIPIDEYAEQFRLKK